ncbi:MAG: HTH-type transcriptional activator IlvY, partial [Candidatus Electrothrix sp. AR1]|nr:HTH-type transcriptional activator IlvY [Candidatus Electrothrix sp. AR1]
YPDTVQRKKKGIDWQKTPIIMPKIGLSRQRIDYWFTENHIVPDVYAEVAGNEAIIAMVSLGCGVGVVPLLVLEKSPAREQVKTLEPSPRLAPFSIAICTMRKKNRSPQVQAFWKIATSTEKDSKKG